MKCRLCLQEKELIGTSHIIPQFMYKGLFDDNKKIVETNLFNFNEAKYRPTGHYDKHILCKDCDTKIIGRLESYAAKILYDKKDLEFVRETDENIINLIFKNIDYCKFKLFLISILWRASISKQKIFDKVNLGGKHEETIRKMIHENNSGRRNEFPTCIFGIKSESNLVTKSIAEPVKMKTNRNTSYMFFINGLFYWFNISDYNMPDVFSRIPINEDNEMTIGVLKGKFGDDFLDSYLGRSLRLSKKF